MSFGVGVSDILKLIEIVKNTVQDCRHAPTTFTEASKVCQSLLSLLEGLQTEFGSLDSALRKNERTKVDFALHFRSCQTSMMELSTFIDKYNSLGSSRIKVVDRFKFSKKTYLELRGNLAFYSSRLSEFLQVIGLGSLGRIEKKVDNVQDYLPQLMIRIDQMCAEVRILSDKESFLSDHTDDEKFVWKAFRSKLTNAGFTSRVIREHEIAIFLRIRELTGCGLLDSDVGSCATDDDDLLHNSCSGPVYQLPYEPTVTSDSESSDTASEGTITPKPSYSNLRSRKSAGSLASGQPGRKQSKRSLNNHNQQCEKTSDRAESSSPETSSVPKPRVWRDTKGTSIVRGIYAGQKSDFVVLMDSDKHEVQIRMLSLSDEDRRIVQSIQSHQADAEQQPQRRHSKTQPSPSFSSGANDQIPDLKESQSGAMPLSNKVEDISSDSTVNDDEVSDISRHKSRKSLHGRRTTPEITFFYRSRSSIIPKPKTSKTDESSLRDDSLPAAAALGSIRQVKKLLKSGAYIEAVGPRSWTETRQSTDNEGKSQTQKIRHSFPETTALYRAAGAGHFAVTLYLLSSGADVNARNGYDGRIGDPVLFQAIRHGNEGVVRLLLEFEARQHAYGPVTALHVASGCPNRTIVQDCLDFGAKIDALDGERRSSLYIASERGFSSIVKLLLQEGAKCNTITADGYTPIYKAAGRNFDDVVEYLLSYGTNPALGRGRHGETVMYKAAWYNYLDVVDLLVLYGADPNITNEKRMNAYKGLNEKILHGIVAGLATQHALMNAWAKSPLHAAAYRGHDEMVETLLDAGANINAAGGDGLTAVYLAAQQKQEKTVQLLLGAGAKLATEQHDPVLALLSNKNKERAQDQISGSKAILLGQHDHQELARIGTGDSMVALVSDITKMFARSRRGL